MANYHVGCGITGIFAGTLNKTGNMWNNKSDVTDEAIRSVAQYLLEHEEMLQFKYEEKEYSLAVSPAKNTASERGEAHWVFDGEWSPSTPDGPAECEWCGWVCSNCEEFPTDDDWDDPEEPPKMEFCPHCGKKMTVCKIEEPKRGFRLPSPVPIAKNIEEKVEEANLDYDAGLWD